MTEENTIKASPVKVDGLLGGYLKQIGDDARELAKQDWDKLFLVCGKNRTGKTVFTVLHGYYVDNTLNSERICYSESQFLEQTRKDYPPGTVIIWDESHAVSEHWATPVVRGLKNYFKTYAYKNYIVYLITPTFFDMNKYWCVHRSDFLFEVYASPKRDPITGKIDSNRGQVRLFNEETKRRLYFNGVKTWDMNCVHAKWDRFSKWPKDFPIKEEDLKKRKALTLIEEKKPINADGAVTIARQEYIVRLQTIWQTKMGKEITLAELSYIFGCSVRTLQRDFVDIRRKVAENGLYAREEEDAGAPIPRKLPEGEALEIKEEGGDVLNE